MGLTSLVAYIKRRPKLARLYFIENNYTTFYYFFAVDKSFRCRGCYIEGVVDSDVAHLQGQFMWKDLCPFIVHYSHT